MTRGHGPLLLIAILFKISSPVTQVQTQLGAELVIDVSLQRVRYLRQTVLAGAEIIFIFGLREMFSQM